MSTEPPLGYGFTPVPKRVIAALHARLPHEDFAILAVLYHRASHRRLARREGGTPILTLHQLSEAIGWTVKLDSLSKRLRRLRDRPERFLDWTIEGRDRYVFTLFPDPPGVSDDCPGSHLDACPTTSEPSAVSPGEVWPLEDVHASDFGLAVDPPCVRGSEADVRGTESANSGMAPRPTDGRLSAVVRGAQTSQTKSLSPTGDERHHHVTDLDPFLQETAELDRLIQAVRGSMPEETG